MYSYICWILQLIEEPFAHWASKQNNIIITRETRRNGLVRLCLCLKWTYSWIFIRHCWQTHNIPNKKHNNWSCLFFLKGMHGSQKLLLATNISYMIDTIWIILKCMLSFSRTIYQYILREIIAKVRPKILFVPWQGE